MADEAVICQPTAQVRMPFEENAEQVEGLALETICARPNTGPRVLHGLIIVGAKHTQTQALVQRHGQQVIHRGESAPGRHGALTLAAAGSSADETRRERALRVRLIAG